MKALSVLLRETWELYRGRFQTFVGILFPIFLVSLLSSQTEAVSAFFSLSVPAAVILGVGAGLAGVIVGMLSELALLYAIRDRQEGIGIQEAYARSWKRILQYVWTSILVGIVIAVGFLLLIVPGIIFAVWFSLALFVFVAEGKWGWGALSRSRELVKGNWGAVLVRWAAINVIALLVFLVGSILIGALKLPLADAFASLLGIVVAPLTSVFGLLLYENLRDLWHRQNASSIETQ